MKEIGLEALVTVAIPDIAGSEALAVTLAALARHTPERYEVVLLEVEGQGRNDTNIREIVVSAPFSTPTALNQLVVMCTTPYILLLESGTVVTAGWLSRLLAPFEDAGVGLSGPSTNICWNEQQVMARPGGIGWSVRQIDTYAASVAERYHDQVRPLDTLHSLADFCYLFQRSVAEQLGGFDEAYGAGPCWEIDFNTRTARAGFRAVWVADAYVHRAPMPREQVQMMRSLFTVNKQLYQDRFCGLRLQGKKPDYESHCRGEACEHFAPSDLIQVTLESRRRSQHSVEEGIEHEGNAEGIAEVSHAVTSHADTILNSLSEHIEKEEQESATSQVTISVVNEPPLVSCIMPTRNRRTFVRQTLAYFERQDYANRELIVVDDGEDRVADVLPSDARVSYVPLSKQMSIGEKRNIACQHARGPIVAHWDDDDWYAPYRLSYQVGPLLDKQADIVGLETSCFFDLANWQAWTITPELHRRLFVGDVHGGTLVYWRRIWEQLAHYPARSVAEDALFLQQACRRGAKLEKLPHASSFVYIRHGSNAWSFPLGSYMQPGGWQGADFSLFLPPEDLAFYAALSPRAHSMMGSISSGEQSDRPLVSCIMPTANRRVFVPQAIRYFLRQDYPNRELLILDDGDARVNDLVPADPCIRYVPLNKRMILGAKRNLACELAHGSLIVHWDDDDWIAPHRLSYQVEELERQKADLCGVNRQLYYSPATSQAWLYEYPAQRRRWLAGNTLCYRKEFWARNRFPEIEVGEDTRFVWNPRAKNSVVHDDSSFYVGLVHDANTSRKVVTGPFWHARPVEEVEQLLGADLSFYHLLRSGI